MKIILTQTGGLLGRTKTASAEWPYTAEKFNALVKKIKAAKKNRSKDGYDYFISTDADSKEIRVSISNIEEAYDGLFEKLFEALKTTD